MHLSNFSVNITMHEMAKTFSHDNVTMLTLSVLYPQVNLFHNQAAQLRINRRIQAQINEFYRYASQTLYEQAIADYGYAQKNGFPFRQYEAVLNYNITYNQRCHLSMYRDQYAFTGGAHGNTIRASDTYNVRNGQDLPLSSFFQPNVDYRTLLIEQILKQADEQMRQNPYIYFDNYPSLIAENFNEKSYYLSESGLSIYYQQYEIAPYATGIVVFTIPYETLQWRPTCRP